MSLLPALQRQYRPGHADPRNIFFRRGLDKQECMDRNRDFIIERFVLVHQHAVFVHFAASGNFDCYLQPSP